MGSLLVISGPPGAGKSTVAALIADRCNLSVLVEGDEFFRFLRRGRVEPWLPESHEQNRVVTRVAAAAAGQFRDGGYATVYDGVVGPWFIDQFASDSRGVVDYAVVLPSLAVCLERIRNRVGHSFGDEDAARSMHRQFVEASIEARHVFDDDCSAAEIADAISARRGDGALSIR